MDGDCLLAVRDEAVASPGATFKAEWEILRLLRVRWVGHPSGAYP